MGEKALSDHLSTIIEKIAGCKHTHADIAALRQLLRTSDHIYPKLDEEAVQAIIQAIQKRIQEDRVASQPTTIKLKTSDGIESASLKAAAHWLTGVKNDRTVTFVLPEGYVRHSFSENINRDGVNSGGCVCWENDNTHDARVRLHAWADAPNGISSVSVSEVQGIRQNAT